MIRFHPEGAEADEEGEGNGNDRRGRSRTAELSHLPLRLQDIECLCLFVDAEVLVPQRFLDILRPGHPADRRKEGVLFKEALPSLEIVPVAVTVLQDRPYERAVLFHEAVSGRLLPEIAHQDVDRPVDVIIEVLRIHGELVEVLVVLQPAGAFEGDEPVLKGFPHKLRDRSPVVDIEGDLRVLLVRNDHEGQEALRFPEIDRPFVGGPDPDL